MSISVLILTLNEEINLRSCLETLSFSDDIVVFDSYSSDRTVEIAKEFGARVVQRKFDNWSSHQNWAVQNIDFKHDWVYYSDADERVPECLRDEILDITSDDSREEVTYFARRRNLFMDKWLRHGGMFDVWIARLWKPDKIHWERDVNPIAIIDGKTGYLKNEFLHYFFSKGFGEWFERHNRYSHHEAVETLKSLDNSEFRWREFLSTDKIIRRNALKKLSFKMPCRPVMKFLFMYILKGGFLDGRPGFTYSILQAVYEAMIVFKTKEMRRTAKNFTM